MAETPIPPSPLDDKDVIIAQLREELASMKVMYASLQTQLAHITALLEAKNNPSNPPPTNSNPSSITYVNKSGMKRIASIHADLSDLPTPMDTASGSSSRKRPPPQQNNPSPSQQADDIPFTIVSGKKSKTKHTQKDTNMQTNKPKPEQKQPPTTHLPPASQEVKEKTPAKEFTEKLPPPIIIHNSEKWTAISNRFKTDGLNFTKASLTRSGVRIQPATPNDFRKITKFLETAREPYHSFCSDEERKKSIQIAIRGIPVGTSNEEVSEELTNLGFTPSDVFRMISAKTKNPIPIIKARLPASQKSVYEVRQLCHISVVVEPLNIKPQVPQCHRCQKFWHTKNFCHGHHRCVKCGQFHDSATCEKPKEAPAKCANCGGDHTASYRGCPQFPRLPKKPTPQLRPQSKTTTSGVSYAQAVKPKNLQSQTTANPQSLPPITPQNFGDFFTQLTQMHARMQQFQAQNPLFFGGIQA
jgi:Associated with zinc fingers